MLDIVLENDFFIVINKPSGLSAHNDEPSLLTLLKKQKKPDFIVNRLDKETSGLMVIAKRADFHALLGEALKEGKKTYRALLRGELPKNETKWSKPISDKAEGHKNPQGLKKDQLDALTLVHIERQSKYFTEVTLDLKSGRQHQIRKHACIAGHAILGDSRYNEKKYNEKMFGYYPNAEKRMYLHAEKLEFTFEDMKYRVKTEPLNLDQFFK